MEEAGNRWSKPHVSTPTLRGWMQLRAALKDGLVLVSLEAKDLDQVEDMPAQQNDVLPIILS